MVSARMRWRRTNGRAQRRHRHMGPGHENASRVWNALVRFGARLNELLLDDLTTPDITFQMGMVLNRIDIVSGISGVMFEEAWPKRPTMQRGDLEYAVIGREDLIRSKRASGCAKDLVDVANLEGR